MQSELRPDSVLSFVGSVQPGHKATLTIVNDMTNNHVTIQFMKPEGFQTILVYLMTGPDNERSYSYMGILFGNKVFLSKKNKAPIEKAQKALDIMNWVFRRLENKMPLKSDKFSVRCLHDGRCSCCGKKLTTPESIDIGIGPTCYKKFVG